MKNKEMINRSLNVCSQYYPNEKPILNIQNPIKKDPNMLNNMIEKYKIIHDESLLKKDNEKTKIKNNIDYLKKSSSNGDLI
jgi:hypothetical protein